ncbi:polyamine ABC transporter substrate-binding protein [Dongia sedimenti]|uniref:Spermidine/putrescine ABC transporter substrate-binding protein n=1 Tax=Dongia sedimenti TaxID=3064282 RepID=A0ABU0YL25_9PROT|nr:spermidine/putrescine ABC transporter substrate-binding protein [Rhodospirillaceae bacterium R-7]
MNISKSLWVGAALLALTPAAQAADTLNVLTWCDHEDPALLEPFEQANGVKINFKDIDSTAAILAVLGQSKPGDWDVLVLDQTDTGRLAGMKLLEPLDAKDYPFSDIPAEIADPKLSSVGGTLYTIPEKFGYNTVAYNKAAVDPQAMTDIKAIWDPKFKGRVAMYDYYVPMIEYVAIALGKKPAELSEADLPAIKDKLIALKANSSMIGDVTTVQQALASGAADILVGGGEWVTAGIAKDNPNLDYVIPTQGGVRWQQALAIFAESKQKDLAKKFVQYIVSPEAQGKLATSSCYWGMPANSKAVLSDEQKAILRWSDQPGYIKVSHPYLQMTPEFDKALQAMWAEVLQAK